MSRPRAHMPVSGDPYFNCLMVAPDGQALGYCDKKRFNWYVSRGLAEALPDGSGIRLKFEPAGRSGTQDIMLRGNHCVTCGRADGLTRHHVVPRCYRIWLPEGLKTHNSYDVHALCIECHVKYESMAWKLKVTLAGKHGAPMSASPVPIDPVVARARGAVKALLRHSGRMPQVRRELLQAIVREYLGADPGPGSLEALASQECHDSTGQLTKSHGQLVVEAVIASGAEHEFVVMWRRHFVDSMSPKHMPDGWDVGRLVASRERTSL